jgi:hypothetical protein
LHRGIRENDITPTADALAMLDVMPERFCTWIKEQSHVE